MYVAGGPTGTVRIFDASGALLATTAVAKGLFTSDAYDLGICGGFASDLTAELVSGADLVVALGASLTPWTTRHGRLLPDGVRLAQVDDEVGQLGAVHRVDLLNDRVKALERENRELRQANEILRKASAYFAQAELDRRFKP